MRFAVALVWLTAGLSYQALAQLPAATVPPTPEASAPAHPPDASSTSPVAPAASTAPAAAPTVPAAAPTVPAAATTPAATATAAAAATADAESLDAQLEKRLRGQGYKPYMQNGQRVFCRREDVLGSRLEGRLLCQTLDEARASENEARNDTEHLQRLIKPCMSTGSGKGANCGN
jgi:hypothetical protein